MTEKITKRGVQTICDRLQRSQSIYKQTAYLDFRWRLLDLHEIQLTKHVACATDLFCGTRDIWCNSPNLKTSPVHYKGIDIVEELVRCFMEEKNFDYDKTNSRSYFEGSVYKKI